MLGILLIAGILINGGGNGIDFAVESETETIDPAKSVFVTMTMKVPQGVKAKMPDLRDRVRGFSLIDEPAEAEPVLGADGRNEYVSTWKLIPEPCAPVYKIAPFCVHASPALLSRASDDGALSFVIGPVYFTSPAKREPVTGEMEVDPEKDLPPLSWKLVGWCAAALAAAIVVVWLVVWGLRYLVRRVKEHRMSPIERAWVELDRLIAKGLPGRGRYKDFYVELTMVVRRYIQRKYGIKAPHLTTEEFLAQFQGDGLREFLESADMVKFAGVKATPEMADASTAKARSYLEGDNVVR